ncbi:transglycosylase SLT domain-containing protein, partial [Morganella morganii]
MRNSVKVGVLFIVSIFFSCKSFAYCFNEAGEKYKIDPALLKSIAMQESGLNEKQINKNKRNGKVGSIYFGVMKINSNH